MPTVCCLHNWIMFDFWSQVGRKLFFVNLLVPAYMVWLRPNGELISWGTRKLTQTPWLSNKMKIKTNMLGAANKWHKFCGGVSDPDLICVCVCDVFVNALPAAVIMVPSNMDHPTVFSLWFLIFRWSYVWSIIISLDCFFLASLLSKFVVLVTWISFRMTDHFPLVWHG